MPKLVTRALLAAAAVCLSGGAAIAQSGETFEIGNGWSAQVGGSFEERIAITRTSALDVNRPLPEDDAQLGTHHSVENRTRVGAFAAFRQDSGFFREFRFDVQADVLSGHFTSSLENELLTYDPLQPSGTAIDTNGQHLRKASAEITTFAGKILGGRTVNAWGLGVLAQSGVRDPMQFGFKRTGHYVTRLAYSVMPAVWWMGDRARQDAPFVVGFAYDWLAYDDRVQRRDGDSGNNMIVTAGWFGKDFEAGFFGVRRTQTNDKGLDTNAWVADVHVRGTIETDGWKLGMATEWAFVVGETEVARNVTNPDSIDVKQFGGVVRFDIEKDWFVGRLEGGYASGDSRPYDDTLHSFTFPSDYRVGIALFGEYQRRLTAVAAYHAADPRFSGEPPVGFDEVPSRGAVTQAMYLHPVLGVRPIENLTVLAGAVLARAPEDASDAYRTGLAGGVATGPNGATRKRNLGLELDMGVRYQQPIGAGISVEGRFDFGVVFPGEVFDDAQGNEAEAFGVAQGQLLLQGSW